MKLRSSRGCLPLLLPAALLAAALGCTRDKLVLSWSEAKLSDLSASRRLQLCARSRYAVAKNSSDQRTKHALCLAAATFGSTLVSTEVNDAGDAGMTSFIVGAGPVSCEETYAHCLADSSVPSAEADAGIAASCSASAFQHCDATVAEFEACSAQSIESLVRALGDRSCSDLRKEAARGMPLSDDVLVPDACASLYQRCPDLIFMQQARPACTAHLVLAGAVGDDLQWSSQDCAFSGDFSTERGAWLSIRAPGVAPFETATFFVSAVGPDTTVLGGGAGVQIAGDPDGGPRWRTLDGCMADVERQACSFNGRQGLRFRIWNGHCATALADTHPRPAKDVRVTAFSASFECVATE